jgi:hypothetical protein
MDILAHTLSASAGAVWLARGRHLAPAGRAASVTVRLQGDDGHSDQRDAGADDIPPRQRNPIDPP